jgi:hypothetical protein
VAEYPANGPTTSPLKEYGYRNGQILVAAEAASATNVTWTSTVGVAASGNRISAFLGPVSRSDNRLTEARSLAQFSQSHALWWGCESRRP